MTSARRLIANRARGRAVDPWMPEMLSIELLCRPLAWEPWEPPRAALGRARRPRADILTILRMASASHSELLGRPIACRAPLWRCRAEGGLMVLPQLRVGRILQGRQTLNYGGGHAPSTRLPWGGTMLSVRSLRMGRRR